MSVITAFFIYLLIWWVMLFTVLPLGVERHTDEGRGFDAGAPREALISLSPKSVTAGVAMGITETLGGDPALSAVLVILTGILGALMVTPLMNGLRVTDWRARGFAVGLASHGIGAARAFQVNETAGAFAGVAMGLNALFTALIVPPILRLMLG